MQGESAEEPQDSSLKDESTVTYSDIIPASLRISKKGIFWQSSIRLTNTSLVEDDWSNYFVQGCGFVLNETF